MSQGLPEKLPEQEPGQDRASLAEPGRRFLRLPNLLPPYLPWSEISYALKAYLDPPSEEHKKVIRAFLPRMVFFGLRFRILRLASFIRRSIERSREGLLRIAAKLLQEGTITKRLKKEPAEGPKLLKPEMDVSCLLTNLYDFIETKTSMAAPAEFRLWNINVELTYDCNAKCVICDTWQISKRPEYQSKVEIDYALIKGTFDASSVLKQASLVVLGGSEPLLHNDFSAIMDYFLENHPAMTIGFLTNALDKELLRRKISEFYRPEWASRFFIGLSLDGIGPLHDKIRGIKGAFARWEDTVHSLRKEYDIPNVSLNFTITPLNYTDLTKVYRYTIEHGIGFSAQYYLNDNSSAILNWNPEQYEETKEVLDAITGDMVARHNYQHLGGGRFQVDQKPFLGNLYFLSKLHDYETNKRRIFDYCPAGREYAYITPYGDLVFCPIHVNSLQRWLNPNLVVGNIRDKDFDTLWHSNKAEQLRTRIAQASCHCWLNCSVMPIVEYAFQGSGGEVSREELPGT